MQKFKTFALGAIFLLALASSTSITSCAPKYGCPAEHALNKDSKKKKRLLGKNKPKDGLLPKGAKVKM